MLNIPEEVKQLFRQGSAKNNLRIHFPNGEREDITNSNIIAESFSFTESICSQDTLKFGLCEASMVEFETVGVGNIKGCEIEVSMEVDKTGIIKWNMADGTANPVTITSLTSAGTGYFINVPISKYKRVAVSYDVSIEDTDGNLATDGQVIRLQIGSRIVKKSAHSTSDRLEYVFSGEIESDAGLQIKGWISDERYPVTISNLKVEYGECTEWYMSFNDNNQQHVFSDPIPFGRFTVDSCPRQSDMSKRRVIAYDKLKSDNLDEDISEYLNKRIAEKPSYVKPTVFFLEECVADRLDVIHKVNSETLDYAYAETESYWSSAESAVVDGAKKYIRVRWTDYKFNNVPEDEIYRLKIDYEKHQTWFPYEEHSPRGWIGKSINDFMTQNNITNWNWDQEYTYYNYDIWGHVNDSTLYESEMIEGTEFTSGFQEIYISAITAIGIFANSTTEDPEIIATFGAPLPLECIVFEKAEVSEIEKNVIANIRSELTTRNLLSASYELQASFGRIDRATYELENIYLPEQALYPSVDLYPSEDLYPYEGTAAMEGMLYINAVYSDEMVKPYGSIKYKYLTINEEGKEVLEQAVYVIDESNSNTYNMLDNWLLNNIVFTSDEAKLLVEKMAGNIPSFTYYPAEINARGLPYLEAGDSLFVYGRKGSFETIILRRTLDGIQALKDVFESR